MSRVVSSDGTKIHYSVIGGGPPVVLLHGSLTTGASWLPVADLLADRFMLFLIDRRGRSPSGPGATPHSMQREVEDARGVLAIAGSDATLVGHSYGGAVALETALLCGPGELERLIVYEPAVRIEQAPDRSLQVAELRRRTNGSTADGLLFFATNFSSVDPADAAALPSPPPLEELQDLMPSVPDELEAVEALPPDVERYRAIANPTLLLVGDRSNDRQQRTIAALQQAIPNARAERLLRQGHIATQTAPTLVAEAIVTFLRTSSA